MAADEADGVLMATGAATGDISLDGGTTVSCNDGNCGSLSRFLVDVDAKAVSHLAIEPSDHSGGRLVPMALVSAGGDHVFLRCTSAEFQGLPPADRSQWATSTWTSRYGEHQTDHQFVEHRIPDGGVEVYPGADVQAGDGHVGYLRGVVVDADSGQILRLLVTVGHLLGKKDVAISAETLGAMSPENVQLTAPKTALLEP